MDEHRTEHVKPEPGQAVSLSAVLSGPEQVRLWCQRVCEAAPPDAKDSYLALAEDWVGKAELAGWEDECTLCKEMTKSVLAFVIDHRREEGESFIQAGFRWVCAACAARHEGQRLLYAIFYKDRTDRN